MRSMILAVALSLLFTMRVCSGDHKAEIERLQGSWTVVSANTGQMQSDQELLGRSVAIRGDKFLSYNRAGEPEGTLTIRLDLSKKPKQMDLSRTKNDRKQTFYGIYSLEKDRLSISFSTREGGGRPLDFKGGGGPARFRVLVLERKKE